MLNVILRACTLDSNKFVWLPDVFPELFTVRVSHIRLQLRTSMSVEPSVLVFLISILPLVFTVQFVRLAENFVAFAVSFIIILSAKAEPKVTSALAVIWIILLVPE